MDSYRIFFFNIVQSVRGYLAPWQGPGHGGHERLEHALAFGLEHRLHQHRDAAERGQHVSPTLLEENVLFYHPPPPPPPDK